MLPPYEGKSVLELGAVIGSFTEELAKKAAKVLVLDFFRSGINKASWAFDAAASFFLSDRHHSFVQFLVAG